jgi:hypothetical protein
VCDFLERHLRSDRIGREHKDDRVGFADQPLNAFPQILEGINLGAVDQRLEAARLECRFEPIRKGHVLARIGDEDFGFELNVRGGHRIRSHQAGCGSHVSAPHLSLNRETCATALSLLSRPMSVVGQTRTSSDLDAMSAVLPITDATRTSFNVAEGP